ncbi:hypothetical protein [Longivirga aurantiaca]|uniref:DUF2750 domain-containing protein n=1 Tax=Longivirga aurantiaca TaxID=1837743 RepID=A0ABW1SYI4_9ACTN
MSERMLEIARDADGRFLATVDERRAPVVIDDWDDVRRLRNKTYLVDHWSDDDLAAFIALHGHPFDQWWSELSAACADALVANPGGQVPSEHQDEVKRTLNRQPRQAGLGLDGSSLSPALRAYVEAKSA